MRLSALFLLPLLLLAAARPARQRPAGGFRPAEATRVLLVPPLGAVSVIARGNRLELDPNASLDAAELLRQALYRHDEKLHLEGEAKIAVADTLAQRRRNLNLGRAFGLVGRNPRLPLAAPQPWLDSLLAPRGQRYALLAYAGGFTRTAANLRGILARDLGIVLLSMGTVMPLSSVASTRVVVLLYDGEQHQVVYYKASWPAEKDPLAGVVIDRELTDLLAKDFSLTNRI